MCEECARAYLWLHGLTQAAHHEGSPHTQLAPHCTRTTPLAPPSGLDSPWLPGVEVCELRNVFAYSSAYWYSVRWSWLCYLFACGVAWATLFGLLRRYNFRSVYLFLLLADIAGGFTVDAAVAVSTLLFDLHLIPCFGGGGLCQLYFLAEPIFWIDVLVLCVTAAVQVFFVNRAMQARHLPSTATSARPPHTRAHLV